MQHRLIIPLLVLAFSPFAQRVFSAETTLISYALGKVFKVTITDDAIAKSPAWEEDSENPPLSAKKALRLATELKETLVKDSDDYQWKLKALALCPAEGIKWYWLATFEAQVQGFSTGLRPALRLVVLMDGTTIKPEVGGTSD